jgi:hypothetical protein
MSCRPGLLLPTAALLLATAAAPAHADRGGSTLSELSALPVALSVAVPVSVLVAGGAFVVVAVQATAEGTAWILERVADGLRFSVVVASRTVEAASEIVGAAVVVTAVTTGCILSAGGRVIAYVPNDEGRLLLHHEQVSR